MVKSKDLKRQGLIVAMSGGIDSSTVTGLCVKALGKERPALQKGARHHRQTPGPERNPPARFGISRSHAADRAPSS